MAETRRRRRALPDIEAASVEHGVGPARDDQDDPEVLPAAKATTVEVDLGPQSLPAALAATIPGPHDPYSTEPVLSGQERDELDRCERIRDIADAMFWVVGRALLTIRQAELYRDYDSFEAYCAEVWDLSDRRARQIMEVTPLAERLAEVAGTGKIFPVTAINEAQVRALLPAAKAHGQDAALHVFGTLTQIQHDQGDRQRITAALLTAAIAALPQGPYDKSEAAGALQAFMAAPRILPTPREPEPATPAHAFAAEVARVRSLLRRTAGAPRAERRKFADELRALADELENEDGAQTDT